jgi:hypothetical protein
MKHKYTNNSEIIENLYLIPLTSRNIMADTTAIVVNDKCKPYSLGTSVYMNNNTDEIVSIVVNGNRRKDSDTRILSIGIILRIRVRNNTIHAIRATL